MRRFRRAALVAALLLVAADLPDPRGWSPGVVAAETARVVSGPAERPELALPRALAITGPTFVVYFSPTCPHCQHVAPEIEALSQRLAGTARTVWVASGRATDAELAVFRRDYGVTAEVVRDADGAIAAALGARSTPSALLLDPSTRGRARVRDAWFPYAPGYDVLVEGRARGDVWGALAAGGYQGDGACGACHREELRSAQLTHHSVAFWTLVDDGKEADPACNRCHVTGAGQPGGFDGDPASDQVNVGCEACHGPSGPHDGAADDARASCVGCHDAEHSIAFSVEKGLPHIDHFAANGKTDAEIQAHRRAMVRGELPRPLLAFPAGPTAGAAACQSCHPAEHAHWQGSPHARAMATLATEGADDPTCVRCHATARQSGPAPTALDGFRTAESVGCESCHGPGAEHAASGGQAPIEGLGEDCPVCVIEAVCTTCHTATWDPDWALAPMLDAARHRAP